MTRDEFWALIERAREGNREPDEVAEQVAAALEALSGEEIYEYLQHEAALMEQSYTWALWGAAYLANGGCSDDGFDYFRGWLLTRGREAFERALRDPDSLVELLPRNQDAECEDMIYIGARAYERVTGQMPQGPTIRLPSLGEGWDFDDDAEMARCYPRLYAQFRA